MTPLLQRAASHAGSQVARAIQMMYDGVAFRKNNLVYEVYSHEGDGLGEISVADVSYAIMTVKQAGQPVGKLQDRKYDNVTKTWSATYEPAFTFAWVGWHPIDGAR
jgi:hypothetical protein